MAYPQRGEIMRRKNLKKALACTLAFSVALGNTSIPQKAKAAEDSKAADISTGLVGYYDFEDSLANKASLTGGTAKLHGGAGDTWNSAATGTENYSDSIEGFGKAYHFLGDTDAGRGEGLELDAIVAGTEYTVSFWVKPENYGVGTTSLVFANHDESCFSINSLNGFNCSALLGKLWDWDNRGSSLVCLDGVNSGDIAAINKWTMVTVTCKSGEQKLYFNGREQASATSVQANVTETLKEQPIFLGINWWDESFKGLMDEVRIYNRVLTAEDIAELSIVPTTGIKIQADGYYK